MGFETLVIQAMGGKWYPGNYKEVNTPTATADPWERVQAEPQVELVLLELRGGAESPGNQGGQSSQDWAPRTKRPAQRGVAGKQ